MIKQTMTVAAWAVISAAPLVVSAQATVVPPAQTTPGQCDCPVGDSRGDLRNLAAFAPLGLLGALAAAGGGPALFATADPVTPGTDLPPPGDSISEGGNRKDPIRGDINPVPTDIPIPVPPDSLRGGIVPPATGTPLPSAFIIGSGLIALGCVSVFRARG